MEEKQAQSDLNDSGAGVAFSCARDVILDSDRKKNEEKQENAQKKRDDTHSL